MNNVESKPVVEKSVTTKVDTFVRKGNKYNTVVHVKTKH